MAHSFAKLPLEILAQITSHLEARDILSKLVALGSRLMLSKLRNGGINTWIYQGYDFRGEVQAQVNFLRGLRSLTTVELDLTASVAIDTYYVRGLPSSLRSLSIKDEKASEIFRDDSALWDASLQPLGFSTSKYKIWIVRNSLPSLEKLHVTNTRGASELDDEFSLAQILLGLPSTLQDLSLPFKYSSLDIYQLLPPNITKLHNVYNALPTSQHLLESITTLGLEYTDVETHTGLGQWAQTTNLDALMFPPGLTHLCLCARSPLCEVDAAPLLPLTLVKLEVRSSTTIESRCIFQSLRLLPLSLTYYSISNVEHDSPTKATLQQLGSLQRFVHMKTFKIDSLYMNTPKRESALWSELMRLVPNVETFDVYMDNAFAGLESKHLKQLNPLVLRSLKAPLGYECWTMYDGISLLESILPNLTDLNIVAQRTFDLETVPTTVTSFEAHGPCNALSLMRLPKSVTKLRLHRVVIDTWNEEMSRLFSAVRTADGELIALNSSSITSQEATSMTLGRIRSSDCPIDKHGNRTFSTGPGDCRFAWNVVPTHLPRSLTELIIKSDWDLSVLITSESLPNLTTLSVAYPFNGLEALVSLRNLKLREYPSKSKPLVGFPPNLTRLFFQSAATQKSNLIIPPSVTHLEASGLRPSDVSALSSLQTLDARGFVAPMSRNSTRWTFEHFPATLTRLVIPSSILPPYETIDFDVLYQRLPLLRHFGITGSNASIALLEDLYLPSFPEQAIMECDELSFCWNDIFAIAARIDDIPVSKHAETEERLIYYISQMVSRAYPRLRYNSLKLITEGSNLTAGVWSKLLPFLDPSTSNFGFIELPVLQNGEETLHWPAAMTSLSLSFSKPSSVYQLPTTLQSLTVHGYFLGTLSKVLLCLPQSLTSLDIVSELLFETLTAWPPRLKHLGIVVAEAGAKSLMHLPDTLEHLQINDVVAFNLARYLPPSLKCLQADVTDSYAPLLLEHTTKRGCLWIANQRSALIDVESFLSTLIASLRAPTHASTPSS